MGQQGCAHDFADVYSAELDEIVRRRNKAGLPTPDDHEHARKSVMKRVGLALSGGGIRSAAFNLGLLQALDSTGVLRHVDYLSTVSGGGYVGSFLSAAGAAPPPSAVDQDGFANAAMNGAPRLLRNHHGRGTALPSSILPPETGGLGQDVGLQPPHIQSLIRGGEYLSRPVAFFNDWFSGWVLVSLVVVSLLVSVLSLLAFVYRMIDYRRSIDFFYALGFQSDVSRAFVLPLLVFFVWCAIWLRECARQVETTSTRRHKVTTALFVGALATALLAVAALLGTGDIYLPFLGPGAGETAQPAAGAVDVQNALKVALMVLLVVALLPYLRPDALIRSGSQPRHGYERWIFRIAGYAFFVGFPLLIFGILAKEDISGWNQGRPNYGMLTPIHIRDGVGWHYFLPRIRAEAESSNTSTSLSPDTISSLLWRHFDAAKSTDKTRSLYDAICEDDAQRERWNRELWLPERWWNFLTIWKTQRRLLEDRKKLVRYLNDDLDEDDEPVPTDKPILGNSELYKEFPSYEKLEEGDDRKRLWTAARIAGMSFASSDEKKQGDATARAERTDPGPLESKLMLANWALLQSYYGRENIRDPDTVFAYVVTRAPAFRFPFFYDGDQAWRLNVFMISLLVFLLAGVTVKVNATSVHNFYRDRLAAIWIRSGLDLGRTPRTDNTVPLTWLGSHRRIAAPYHLINGTVNFLGSPNLSAESAAARSSVSEDSSCARFLFSKRFCGAEALGYARTTEYMRGNYDLANAMAISGAAVTPAVFGNPFLVVIILAFNLRLGQWILNPTRTPGDGSWLDWLLSRRRPIPLLLDWWSHRNPRNRRYCFVTDGGHYDNLGLEALLERRCRLIIASDASADPDGSFEDLLKVLRRNTVHSGIRVSPLSGGGSRLGLEALTGARSTESSHSRLHEVAGDGGNGASRAITHARGDGARVFSHQHYFVARIEYPQKEEVGPGEQIREGYLIYLKPSLSGDEGDAEVLRYIEKGSEFPHDSTINQFYDESRFEAYRRLGYHIGMRVFDECFAGRDLHSAKPSLAAWHPRRHPAEAAQPDAKMA